MFKETLDKLSIASHEAVIDGTYNTLNTFKNKSIEWKKNILSPYIEYIGETRKVRTKAEKVYRLTKTITKDIVDKAIDTVGVERLKEFEEKTKKN